MAVYAVGDVQGCRDELLALLDRLRFDPALDRLWLTGDLVNRGPDSLGVLRLVRGLGATAVAVLGNHDLHLLAVACGHGPGRRDPGIEQVLAAPDREELLDWLLRRPLLHHEPALGWTLVHAGLPPDWDLATAVSCAREVESALAGDPESLFGSMYGNEPRRWSPTLAGVARYRYIINCMTRLRYVDAGGSVLLSLKGPPQQAPSFAIPWFRHPARATAGERIVFGHWSTLGLNREAGTLCLDGGCVWGGRLCAARLDRDEPPVALDCAGHRVPGED
ncbi:MAG: symmetrical bis(5-nucleosyl)-tetraphosphatase [Proteobacteria bacterium]|nr:symmetrical bis(5-nucleosyl)-tetraphosphatase [Pseudomonadota bacterium]